MSKVKFSIVIILLSTSLSGCPWPFPYESDNYEPPPDPDPINLESVLTSDIRMRAYAKLFEESGSIEILAELRTSEYVPLLPGAGASFELQVLDDQGLYQAADITEYETVVAGARFRVPAVITPVSYRLLLNRSNSEIVELFNVELKAKITSESTATNTTYGNGDSFEFTWSSYDSNGRLDTVPPGWIRYRLDCGNPFVSRETPGSRIIYGSVDLSEDQGLETAPTIFNVDAALSEHDITNFPCELFLERIFYLHPGENGYFPFSGTFGNNRESAELSGNELSFGVDARIFTVTVEGN